MSEIPETDTGAAFAAGQASAVAEAASEDAAVAEVKAEIAEEAAEQAAQRAAEAETVAWDARIAVEELGSRMEGQIAELRAAMPKPAPPAAEGNGGAAGDGAVPAPERKADTDPPKAPEGPNGGEDKPKRRAYGARRWFGDD